MKTKLLRRWKKAIKKHLCLDKDFIITPRTYDAIKQKFIEDETRIVYLRADKPTAPILWKELDIKSNWFLRYWKHSIWKSRIQLLAAAKGISEFAAAIEVLEERRNYQAKHPNIVVPSLHKVVPSLIPESAV